MRLYRIIKKPITTEKSASLEMEQNTYVCEVSSDATKIDVKKAILELYGVEVARVNVLHSREKFKMGKKGTQVKRRTTKKAYITLKDEKAKIDFSIIK